MFFIETIVSLICLFFGVIFYFKWSQQQKNKNRNNEKNQLNDKKNQSPLTKFKEREEKNGFPLAARFLAFEGIPNFPKGSMSAGIHVTNDGDDWVDIGPDYQDYIQKKKQFFESSLRSVFRSDESSIEAQQEYLELLLQTLHRKYSNYFTITPPPFTIDSTNPNEIIPQPPNTIYKIHVKPTNDIYYTNDFESCPLKLATLLIQEDVCILSESDSKDDEQIKFEGPSGKLHTLVAASVCFSFSLPSKFLLPMGQIHAAVNGYEKHLQHKVNKVFALMKSSVIWRSNWHWIPKNDSHEVGSSSSDSSSSSSSSSSHSPIIDQSPNRVHKSNVGDIVFVNINGKDIWKKGEIIELSENFSYKIKLFNENIIENVIEDDISPLETDKTNCLINETKENKNFHLPINLMDHVSVNWRENGVWYTGTITNIHNNDNNEKISFDIRYDDGDFEKKIPIKNIMLLKRCSKEDKKNLPSPYLVGAKVQTNFQEKNWQNGYIEQVNISYPESNNGYPSFSFDIKIKNSQIVKKNVPIDNIQDSEEFDPSENSLKVEFQTLRRMPKTKNILFSIRVYKDPLKNFKNAPEAAEALAWHIRKVNKDLLKYKGLDDPLKRKILIKYLMDLSLTDKSWFEKLKYKIFERLNEFLGKDDY